MSSVDIPLPPRVPEDEYVRIVDPLTHGIIYCIPRSHHFTEEKTSRSTTTTTWIERNTPNTAVNSLIDICHTKPPYNHESFAAYDEARVPPGRVRTCVILLADYACLMHTKLQKHGSVILIGENFNLNKCSILLVIFLFMRGMVQENILAWLTDSFQAQLPTIATYQRTRMKQVSFPNFQCYDNVVSLLCKLLCFIFDSTMKNSLIAHIYIY